MCPEERNGLGWQVKDHEKRIERLERYEPAVVARRLDDHNRELTDVEKRLHQRMDAVDDRLKWQTRALLGAMLTMLGTLIVVLILIPHG